DVAGRPTRRATGDVSTRWEYDTAAHGLGKISSIVNSNGYREDYYYDLYGRRTGNTVLIDQEQFLTSNEFDAYGRITKVSYPNSFAVRNKYDQKGFFISVEGVADGKTYWMAKNIDVLGRVTQETFGNGVTTTKRYDQSDERIRHITARTSGGHRILD